MKLTTRSLIKYRGEECLNCGVPLDAEDKYCHQCGQLNSTKKLALRDFFGEFFSNMFSYDSRVWRTIIHLLFKPGFVSKEFISGKRLNYANPFRFFLSVCIVFFLMVQIQEFVELMTDNQIQKAVNKSKKDVDVDVGNGLFAVQIDDEKDLQQLTDEELSEIENKPLVGKYIANEIRKEQAQASTDSIAAKKPIKELKETKLTQKQLDSLGFFNGFFEQIDYYQDFYSASKIADPATALSKMGHHNTRYNQSLYEKNVLIQEIGNDSSVLLDIFLPKLPVFLFLFTPVLTVFLWLLYARRNFSYMEHLIFAFNVFTFSFLCMIILLLISWISFGYVNLIQFFFWFIGPFYLYKAMRNFYGQRRFKTILKFLMISVIFVIGLSIGISFLFLIGILLY